MHSQESECKGFLFDNIARRKAPSLTVKEFVSWHEEKNLPVSKIHTVTVYNNTIYALIYIYIYTPCVYVADNNGSRLYMASLYQMVRGLFMWELWWFYFPCNLCHCSWSGELYHGLHYIHIIFVLYSYYIIYIHMRKKKKIIL
jgi:hypothetical protein